MKKDSFRWSPTSRKCIRDATKSLRLTLYLQTSGAGRGGGCQVHLLKSGGQTVKAAFSTAMQTHGRLELQCCHYPEKINKCS